MNPFPSAYPEIMRRLNAVDPLLYGTTRNYVDGAVSRLSPYISRGILTTRQIAGNVLARGYEPGEIEIFLKELAWRDYFQRVWMALGDKIDEDIRRDQPEVDNRQMSTALMNAQTGIVAIDKAVEALKQTAYMHNHLRMYLASVACNSVRSHWKIPAKWLHYYLLDADWASNALSWQWVAGSFSDKKYVANQENINRFSGTDQSGTFLDVDYPELNTKELPEHLQQLSVPALATRLPETGKPELDPALPIYVYNFYNLDYSWDKEVPANRVLLLEPRFFDRYPVCENTLNFVLECAANIEGIVVFSGNFEDVFQGTRPERIHFKEHPSARHYRGSEHSREWMFPGLDGYFPSFSSYWKKAKKLLHELSQNINP